MLREVGHYRKSYWCQKQFAQAIYHQLYEIYMACILLLIPVTVMSFAYISICKELWAMTFRRSEMRAGGYVSEVLKKYMPLNVFINILDQRNPLESLTTGVAMSWSPAHAGFLPKGLWVSSRVLAAFLPPLCCQPSYK